ncbi:MAG: transcriptional regulator, partial [Anaerolineae bacterium]
MSRKRRWSFLAAIVLLALLLRAWAVMRLPLDFDEPTYLEAASDYAAALRAGDWRAIVDYEGNREHPALVKLLYGLVVLALGEEGGTLVAGLVCRALSAILGTLAVLVLALFDPLAGGLLAVHTLAVKYTSQVYLEALPHLASLAAVLALSRLP